jgi:hypothetical protein
VDARSRRHPDAEALISKEPIELKVPVERAILVGAPRKGSNARHSVAQHLEELERLVDTAGGLVVGEVTPGCR